MATEIQHDFEALAHFTSKQEEAHNRLEDFKYMLYGGAMGGGKSYWLRWELVFRLLEWNALGIKNVMAGLFCEDYPALKDRHLSKIGTEFPEWLGYYHSDHKEYGRCFVFAERFGKQVIAFRNLDDASKYQSAEFAIIAVDELTKNVEETFDDLRNRLRWPGISDVKFIAATNPGGIGHAWVKAKWLDNRHDENEQEMHLFKYIPARADDNPYLDKNYLALLDSLPADKRRAYREGDWDIFKGQYFTEFRRELHVCKPFQIPADWRKFISIDYGYAKPSAVYWIAISPDDILYVYRELYEKELTYSQLTEVIIAMTPDSEIDEIAYWVADPACWARRGEEESALSGADTMIAVFRDTFRNDKKRQGKSLILKQGNNDRINGWNVFREYLRPIKYKQEVIAKIQMFPQCSELIRTLPSLVYDEHRVEDLDTDGEDHGADSVRYGIMSQPRPAKTTEQILDDFFKRKMKKQEQRKRPSLMRGY